MVTTYLAASLPALVFGAPPPFGVEAFRQSCEAVLTPDDRAVLDAVLADRPAAGSAFSDGWLARDTQLRNAVVRARAAHLGVDARPFLRDHAGWDASVAAAVTDAFAKPNPIEREMALDRIRWHVADDLAKFEPFSLSAVLAFAVKLRIAERWAALDEAKGRERVEAFVAGAGPAAEADDANRE